MQEVLEGGKGLYKLCNYVIISTIKVKRGDEFIPSIVPMVSQTNFLLSREKKLRSAFASLQGTFLEAYSIEKEF